MPSGYIDTAKVLISPDTTAFAATANAGIDRGLAGAESSVDAAVAAMEAEFAGLAEMISEEFGSIRISAEDAFGSMAADFEATGAAIEAEFAGVADSIAADFETAQVSVNHDLDQMATKSEETGGRIAGAFGSMKALAVPAIGGIVAGLGLITAFGLKSAANLEQVNVALDSLTGSVAAGNAQFKSLQQFAAATPFEFKDLTTSAERFDAFSAAIGQTQGQLNGFLTTIGDLVSETGGGAEALNSITLAMGQTASQGKLTLGNLEQINNALPGFSSVAALAAVRGETTAQVMQEISAGTIDAKTGLNQLLQGMQQFPGAAGAMAKQSETLLGVFSTFQDTISQALSNAFAPVIPAIKDSLTQITPIIGNAVNQLAPALGTILAGILPILGQLVTALSAVLTPLLNALGPALGPIGDAFAALGPAIGAVMAALTPLIPLMAQLIGSIGLQFADVLIKLAPVLAALVPSLVKLADSLLPLLPVLTQLLTLFVEVLSPVTALVNLLANHVTTFDAIALSILAIVAALKLYETTVVIVESVTKAWAAIQAVLDAEMIANPIGLVVVAIAALVAGIVILATKTQFFQDTWQAIWSFMKMVGAWFAGPFLDFFKAIGDWFAGPFVDFFKGIGNWFVKIWNDIVDFVTALPGKIEKGLEALPGKLEAIISDAWHRMLYALGYGIGLWIKEFLAFPGQVITILTDFWNWAWTSFTNGVQDVWQALQALPGLIAQIFTDLWHDVTSVVSSLWHDVVNYFESLPDRIGNATSLMWNYVRDRFNNGVDNAEAIAQALPGKILAKFDQLKNDAISWGKSAVHWLEDAGRDLISGLINGVENSIQWAINKIKNAMGSIVKGAKDALGVHSPSTVFMEIGHQSVAGYAKGLDDSSGVAATSIQDLLSPATGAAAGKGAAGNSGGGISFGPGSIVVQFAGVVPTEQQAFQTGQAVGAGMLSTIATRNAVRTM